MTITSIRLNKTIRDEIVANVMTSYDEENPLPPKPQESILDLDRAVCDWFLEANQKEINKWVGVKAKHPKLLTESNHIQYTAHKGETRTIYFSTKTNSTYDENDHYVASKIKLPYFWAGQVIKLDNPDTVIPPNIQNVIDNIEGTKKEVRLAKKAYAKAELERSQYEEQVRQVCYGVNTSRQLFEVWPEVERFVPSAIVKPSNINLPSVNIRSLNSKLGK